jgi:CrcB protein
MPYLWVTAGSAIGGLLRYVLTRMTLTISAGIPYGTILINVLGSFVIGYFAALTMHSGRYAVSDNVRLFVMVGVCGGFTTFSSFSLQTFTLLQEGAWGKALINVAASVVLCMAAVTAGHFAAQHSIARTAIVEAAHDEEHRS